MPNRAVLGQVSGVFKASVSKPGFDVLTAASSDLMFDSSRPLVKLIAIGGATVAPAAVVNIPITGLGSGENFIYYMFDGPTPPFPNPLLNFRLIVELTSTNLRLTNSFAVGEGSDIIIRYGVWGS